MIDYIFSPPSIKYKRLLANANYINVKQTKIKVLQLHEVYGIMNINRTSI